jgi:hypothetical protein
MTDPKPKQQDIDNAAYRAEVAAKQAAEYAEAERLALEAVGPGWKPWMKLVLLDSDYHRVPSPPVAIVYKVYTGDKKLTENSIFVRRMPDGSVRHDTSYESLFGELLLEPHPTRTLDIKGKVVHPPRYSLCWSPLEFYLPRSAESLAAAREKREQKTIERQAKEHPLFADAIRSGAWRPDRGRS